MNITQSVSSIPNWHKYLISFLMALAAVCGAILTGAVVVPPELQHIAGYAGITEVFIVAFLPRIQTDTGPGAPPIISPPPKES